MSDVAVPQEAESGAMLSQAREHERAGRLFEAARLYQRILETEPGHAQANYQLGIIALEAGEAAAGLGHLAAALDADPANGQYWLSYIDALFRAGHQDDARAMLAHARRQGLEGEAVDALLARFGGGEGEDPAEPDTGPEQAAMDAVIESFRAGRYEDVVERAQRMSARFPDHDFAWKILGVAHKLLGRNEEALAALLRAVELRPDDVESHHNLGVVLQQRERLDEAEAAYRRALEIDPAYADARLNLAAVLTRRGRLAEAEEALRSVLLGNPGCVAAHGNLGAVHLEQGKLEEAVSCLEQALRLDADNASTHDNLGITLYRLGRLEEAEQHFRQALRIDPDRASVHTSLGVALQEQGHLDEADTHFQFALLLDSEDARAHERRGSIHYVRGQLCEAERCFRRALEIVPEEAGIHFNLGRLLRKLRRFDEAEASLRRALALRPDDNMGALNELGLTLMDAGALGEAEDCLRRVLEKMPDNPGVLGNLGTVLAGLGRVDEAEACFRGAQQRLPDDAALHSNLLYFLSLNDCLDAPALFAEHLCYAQRFERDPESGQGVPERNRDPMRQLNVGFVSADFNRHPVANFIEPVLAQLAGDARFTLHAYYNNLVNDETTARLRGHFAQWNVVATLPAAELVDAIRKDGIDILIDLSGHTAANRLPVFARKPAPIQATWMGYPGTTGLRSVDYCFTDRFHLPPGRFDGQFSEKLVHLPAAAPFLAHPDAPPVGELPAGVRGYMSFASFARPDKISRKSVTLWAALLRALPDARMVLGGMPDVDACGSLLDWFSAEGVETGRLVLHRRCDMSSYLDLHRQVDICLDTFPYNNGTTTLHALWMGVPTLTLAGDTVAARSGAAILGNVGLGDFVAHDVADFLAKGISWSERRDELAEIRAGLRERFLRSARGQPEVVAEGVASALRIMWQRWCAGLPTESFEVSLDDAACIAPGSGA